MNYTDVPYVSVRWPLDGQKRLKHVTIKMKKANN